jgi:hypothetical protein
MDTTTMSNVGGRLQKGKAVPEICFGDVENRSTFDSMNWFYEKVNGFNN